MCAYAYTQLLPTWKQRLERTNQPWQGVGHYFNHQSMMCGKAACRAINRQIQEPSHPNFWRPWWGKLPLKDAPSLRNERWEQPESYPYTTPLCSLIEAFTNPYKEYIEREPTTKHERNLRNALKLCETLPHSGMKNQHNEVLRLTWKPPGQPSLVPRLYQLDCLPRQIRRGKAWKIWSHAWHQVDSG